MRSAALLAWLLCASCATVTVTVVIEAIDGNFNTSSIFTEIV